jgi:hypothetical protein
VLLDPVVFECSAKDPQAVFSFESLVTQLCASATFATAKSGTIIRKLRMLNGAMRFP